MLKHLLSVNANADQTDAGQAPQQHCSFTQPNIEYKYEHDPLPPLTTTQSSPHENPQPTKFGYDLAPTTIYSGGVTSTTNNNTICHEAASYSTTMSDEIGYEPASNTSDFLSSTFNLLTSDNLADPSATNEWPQYSIEHIETSKQPREFYDPSHQIYYTQPNTYPPSHYGSHHDEQMHHQLQTHEMQAMRHTDSMEPAEKRPKKSNGPSARNCQLEYTENFKRFINIPTQGQSATSSVTNSATTPQRSLSANNSDSGVQSPADSEESDSNTSGQTIQCPACKSVYSSPRSLTGHIGRTEKCRELIGRDYLDEIMKMGKSGCIPDPSAGEGINPVCPHCNRFISHYKGNIRRHVNSCKKTPGRKDSGASAAEPAGSNSSNVSLASYDTASTPNPLQHEDHQTQPCSSNKDVYSDYALQPMHSHPIHQQPQIHTIHFAHPDERHLPPAHHHQLPPYHLIPTTPVHHTLPPPQHQMTLITHLQSGSHHLHQQSAQIHPSYAMEYMPYEPIHHQHIPPQPPPAQHYEIQYVRTPPENPSQHATQITSVETPAVPKLPKLKHNGMVPVNDPYHCSWCTFSTVYKGNMKRHLISCHNCTDELLRKYNFELERLRKSNPHPATIDCLPFIEIKPPQPPGTRRPRNPPNNKLLGRPKKNNTSNDKSSVESAQQFDLKPDRMVEPQLQYNVLHQSQQSVKIDYQTQQMNFNGITTSNQLIHPGTNPNPGYIIKDCANDSGLGMEMNEYEVASLHQPEALHGY